MLPCQSLCFQSLALQSFSQSLFLVGPFAKKACGEVLVFRFEKLVETLCSVLWIVKVFRPIANSPLVALRLFFLDSPSRVLRNARIQGRILLGNGPTALCLPIRVETKALRGLADAVVGDQIDNLFRSWALSIVCFRQGR